MMESQQQTPARVLIADDDFSIRQLVCTIVKREGLEVDCAADGLEAIEKLKGNEYSVILLDLMMPRVDGFGVVEHLRKHPQTQKPVVLVITAYADQKFKEIDPSLVAGVVRKPFEVSTLGTLVKDCVDGFDSHRAAEAKVAAGHEAPRGWQEDSTDGRAN